jgi:hypothetical protein
MTACGFAIQGVRQQNHFTELESPESEIQRNPFSEPRAGNFIESSDLITRYFN